MTNLTLKGSSYRVVNLIFTDSVIVTAPMAVVSVAGSDGRVARGRGHDMLSTTLLVFAE